MQNIFSPFVKLVAVAACALALGSCNRAEYAMLPKGGSYHGVARAATPVPARRPVPAAEAPAAATAAAAQPLAPAPKAPVAVAGPTSDAATPAAAPGAPALSSAAASIQAAPARKLSLVQRLALAKVTKKLEKAAQKSGAARQHDNTASVAKGSISGNLRIGIILLLVGLLVGILNSFVGTIIAIVGLIFIVLWLLDEI